MELLHSHRLWGSFLQVPFPYRLFAVFLWVLSLYSVSIALKYEFSIFFLRWRGGGKEKAGEGWDGKMKTKRWSCIGSLYVGMYWECHLPEKSLFPILLHSPWIKKEMKRLMSERLRGSCAPSIPTRQFGFIWMGNLSNNAPWCFVSPLLLLASWCFTFPCWAP